MPEIFKTQSFERKACLEDFLDDNKNTQNKKDNKNHSNNNVNIEKNQQEFGNRKRIKP